MNRRAGQMLRQVARLEGQALTAAPDDEPARDGADDEAPVVHHLTAALDDEPARAGIDDEAPVVHLLDDAPFDGALRDDGLGFGDELLDPASRRSRSEFVPAVDRGPQPADPSVDAWCSFCCKPTTEVGALVAGPAGAFICGGCVSFSAGLLSRVVPAPATVAAKPPGVAAAARLPAQARARARWDERSPRLALVLGPEGSGKTTFLEQLGAMAERPFTRAEGTLALLDLVSPLSDDEASAVLRWLHAQPRRQAVIAVRGLPPTPALVLEGDGGVEPIYDTDSLHRAAEGHLSTRLLSSVDAVLPMAPPDRAALTGLAAALLAAKRATLSPASIEAVVGLAERSGRGARELAALIARIPPGRYTGP